MLNSTQPIYTIGHSTRSAEDFYTILTAHAVAAIVDVRRYPGSRRHPHFSREQLELWLTPRGIAYRHEADLGGRRRGEPDSPNTYWRSESFRAFADYMATPPFQRALERLIDEAGGRATAIMCAEAVPWRCHRQLIADALTLRGLTVLDIMDEHHARPHLLNESAQRLADGRVIYPATDAQQKDLFAK